MSFNISLVSEATLLFLCMKDIESFYYIETKIQPVDFQHKPHRLIFDLMKRLSAAGVKQLTSDQLIAEAQSCGTLDEIGGYEELINGISRRLVEAGSSVENIDAHIEKVKNISNNMKLKKFCQDTSEYFKTISDRITRDNRDKIVDTIVNDLLFLNEEIKNEDSCVSNVEDFITNYAKNMYEFTPVELGGISTGYSIFDKQINGLRAGTLTIIAADKKAGKSAFLSNIASHVAVELNTPVLYIDTEMTNEEWNLRHLAMLSGVEERSLTNMNLNDLDRQRVEVAATKIKDKKITHYYMPGLELDKIISVVNRFYKMENIGLVILDYIKEPDSSAGTRNRNEYQLLGDLTTLLKNLAGKLNIPILTAAQLNQQGKIADSYKILRYADVICYWDRRSDDELTNGGGRERCGNFKLIIGDSRRGGTTPMEGIGYKFYKRTLSVYEVPIDDQYFFSYAINKTEEPDDMEDYLNQPLR